MPRRVVHLDKARGDAKGVVHLDKARVMYFFIYLMGPTHTPYVSHGVPNIFQPRMKKKEEEEEKKERMKEQGGNLA